MKINTRIAASGGRSHTIMAWPRYSLSECVKADGDIDAEKAQMAFAYAGESFMPFTPESSDDEAVYYAALEFIARLRESYERVIADSSIDCSHETKYRQDAITEQRMERGKFVTAFVTIRRCSGGVRVNIGVNNKRGIVGQAEVEAWYFAAVCCQIWNRLQNVTQWVKSLTCDRPEVLANAIEHNHRADLIRKYSGCQNRTAGYCSPMTPDCPFFKNGACTYPEKTK